MHGSLSPARAFVDRVALVTGAGRAVGRAIAQQLGAAGAAVAVVATSRARAAATVDAIRSAGGEASGFAADLADPGSIPGLVQSVEEVFGEVDILINNAATVAPLGPVANLDPAAVLRALSINVASVVMLSGAVIPAMIRQGWGRIANVCGVVGDLDSWPGGNIYAACVAALEAHTAYLAAELTGTGITVNALRTQKMGEPLRTWIAAIEPEAIDDPLIRRFVISQKDTGAADSGRQATTLLHHLATAQTGQIWNLAYDSAD
jgi:NAD(P)-dependent dehydrogenase (short-subunit alcohol dehydrogenase family)